MDQLFLIIPNQARIIISSLSGKVSLEAIQSSISIQSLNSSQTLLSLKSPSYAVISSVPNTDLRDNAAITSVTITIRIVIVINPR